MLPSNLSLNGEGVLTASSAALYNQYGTDSPTSQYSSQSTTPQPVSHIRQRQQNNELYFLGKTRSFIIDTINTYLSHFIDRRESRRACTSPVRQCEPITSVPSRIRSLSDPTSCHDHHSLRHHQCRLRQTGVLALVGLSLRRPLRVRLRSLRPLHPAGRDVLSFFLPIALLLLLDRERPSPPPPPPPSSVLGGRHGITFPNTPTAVFLLTTVLWILCLRAGAHAAQVPAARVAVGRGEEAPPVHAVRQDRLAQL
jgi:hypothetical protein